MRLDPQRNVSRRVRWRAYRALIKNGNTGADAQTDRFTLIPIAVSGEYDGEWDDTDQTPIITSRCDKVYVQGDGYDALKQSLIFLNKNLVSQNKEEYVSYKKRS